MTGSKIVAGVVSGLVLTALLTIPYSASAYTNVVNKPFATVSKGPQNAMIVDVKNPNNRSEVRYAIDRVLHQKTRAVRTSRLAKQIAFYKKAGLLGPNENVHIDNTIMVRSKGMLVMPKPRVTRAGGKALTFSYSYTDPGKPGWDAVDMKTLKDFEAIAKPIITGIYGEPYGSYTVNVVRDDAISDRDALLGGGQVCPL